MRMMHRRHLKAGLMTARTAARRLPATMAGPRERQRLGGVVRLQSGKKAGIVRSADRVHVMMMMAEETEKVKQRLRVGVPAVTGGILKKRSAEKTVVVEGQLLRALQLVDVIVMADAMMAEIAKNATAEAAVEVARTTAIGSVIGSVIVTEVEATIAQGTIVELGLARTKVVVAAVLPAAGLSKW